MGDISGAGSVVTLAIPTLFNVPQQIQGFASDDVFDFDEIESVETLMGVDGVLSAGFVWKPQAQSITLQADSPSNAIFDQWYAYQKGGISSYPANGVVIVPSIGLKLILSNGFLTRYKIPGAKKLITPRRYGITWNDAQPVPV